MKELLNLEKENKDQVEIVNQAEINKEIKLIGSQRKIPGLTLWEFNLKTKELEKAKFQKQDVYLDFSKSKNNVNISNKVIIKEYCFYFQALNYKNALKVLRRKNLII